MLERAGDASEPNTTAATTETAPVNPEGGKPRKGGIVSVMKGASRRMMGTDETKEGKKKREE